MFNGLTKKETLTFSQVECLLFPSTAKSPLEITLAIKNGSNRRIYQYIEPPENIELSIKKSGPRAEVGPNVLSAFLNLRHIRHASHEPKKSIILPSERDDRPCGQRLVCQTPDSPNAWPSAPFVFLFFPPSHIIVPHH
jgi:hypothetical protein